MREKDKSCFQKLRDKVSARLSKSPTYVKFLQTRDKAAEWLRVKLLAFFSCVSPVWNFFFLKTPKPGQSALPSFTSIIPNPFADEPLSNGPTDTQS